MNWSQTAEVLQRLKIPVIAFGIGAQAPVKGKLELSEETKTVLRLIADSTASLGVRGAYSAEVLWDLGIKNVRIVGCPTAFRDNDPDLRIELPPLDKIKKVGVTLRREVSPTYAQDIERYLTFHRDLVKEMAGRFDVVLMAQGEVEEKKLALGTPEQKEEAHRRAEREQRLDRATGISTRRWRSSTASGCSTRTSSPTTRSSCAARTSCSATACTAT